MNQGDRIRVTISDTLQGLLIRIDDLTTGQSGFMVASAANGFQSLNTFSCSPTNFSFHPEFATAKVDNFVPWAALQINVNFVMRMGTSRQASMVTTMLTMRRVSLAPPWLAARTSHEAETLILMEALTCLIGPMAPSSTPHRSRSARWWAAASAR
jgi:hypothetical protein